MGHKNSSARELISTPHSTAEAAIFSKPSRTTCPKASRHHMVMAPRRVPASTEAMVPREKP